MNTREGGRLQKNVYVYHDAPTTGMTRLLVVLWDLKENNVLVCCEVNCSVHGVSSWHSIETGASLIILISVSSRGGLSFSLMDNRTYTVCPNSYIFRPMYPLASLLLLMYI